MWIYFRGKSLGPLEAWEVSMIASKYRNFFIFHSEFGWIYFPKWKKNYDYSGIEPYSKPNIFIMCFRNISYLVIRIFLRGSH